MKRNYLVLIYDPAFVFLVVAIVAVSFLDNLVDREVFEASVLRKHLAVSRLTDAWRPSYDDVWLLSHDVFMFGECTVRVCIAYKVPRGNFFGASAGQG